MTIKETYGKFEYENALDVGNLFSSKEKMFYFFNFLRDELNEIDGALMDGKINMLPCVFYADKGVENIVIDYNFLVKVTGRFIEKYNLGDGNKFIQDFKVEVVRGNPNARARKLLFTHTIFELYWKCAYINSKKISMQFLTYSTPSVFTNNKTTIQFSSVFFVIDRLASIIQNRDLMHELICLSKISQAKQVAFGTSSRIKEIVNCNDFWKKNKESPKKFFFSSKGLSIDDNIFY